MPMAVARRFSDPDMRSVHRIEGIQEIAISHWTFYRSNIRRFLLVSTAVIGISASTFLASILSAQYARAQKSAAQSSTAVPASPQLTEINSVDFNWNTSPSEDLSAAGAKAIHLAECPRGVAGKEKYFYVYISGTGTPESVLVTGGTCAGDGKPGTLTFTTVNSHGPGYALGSATSGIQEASIAARVSLVGGNKAVFKQAGYVRVGPGEFELHAPLTLMTNQQTVDFTGSSVICDFDADCIQVGDQTNYNAVIGVTLINPRGEPTVPHGQHTFVTVWSGLQTRIIHLLTMIGRCSGRSCGTFGAYIKVVADQAFLLDGLDTSGGFGMECTASSCNAVIQAPGPFHGSGGFGSGGDNAAVGWLKNVNLNIQCMGNGIDWQSGNGLRVSDSVIQGYSQYGVRGGLAKGGYNMIVLENVYQEVGNCSNPSGNIGVAGVIAQGGKVVIRDGEPLNASIPRFSKTGETPYFYYLIPHSAKYGYGNALYMGDALTNRSDPIPLAWPDIPTLTDMDILKISAAYDANVDYLVGPYGSGNYAIATHLTRAAANCNGSICTFTDAQIAPALYTMPAKITYFPFISYWPGQLVLGPSGDGSSALANSWAELSLDELNAVGLVQVNTSGDTGQSISMLKCMTISGSPVWTSCLGSGAPATTIFTPPATLMSNKIGNDGGAMKNQKGRLNFLESGTGPTHIITLIDSIPDKTFAAQANRASNDSSDAFIGCDTKYCSGHDSGLAFGAPISLSNYIGNAGDGSLWKERLTDKQKSFAVPVLIQTGSTLTLGSGTPLSQIKIYRTENIAVTNVPAQSCADVTVPVTGLTETDQITGLTPPHTLGNLSLNGYPGAVGIITLHFCNPTSSPVAVPAGVYSFLAAH